MIYVLLCLGVAVTAFGVVVLCNGVKRPKVAQHATKQQPWQPPDTRHDLDSLDEKSEQLSDPNDGDPSGWQEASGSAEIVDDSYESPPDHEALRIAEADDNPGADNQHGETPISVKTSIKPGNRGGTPRGQRNENKSPEIESGHQLARAAELVCWKREQEWVLALELPDKWRDAPEVRVLQDGARLTRDINQEVCWQLEKLSGEIVVQSSDRSELKLACGDDDHLLFKLSYARPNEGRCVAKPTRGSYLAVVPDNWQRDEQLAGTPPAAPEQVCLAGYLAHFFDFVSNEATKIAFRDPSGRLVEIASAGPRFVLVGTEIRDGSDRFGPLFGGSPPRIDILDGKWEAVGTIVLGEEGGGHRKWRTSFEPERASTEQKLPASMAEKQGGWYFLRFYNQRDGLIDSLDFRYAEGLRNIAVLNTSPLPSPKGHKEAVIEFYHDEGWYVKPRGVNDGALKIHRGTDRTNVTVPALPAFDRNAWEIGREDHCDIQVDILLERVWWTLGNEPQSELRLQDRCLSCTRNDFLATSNKVLSLRLPCTRYAESLRIGFSQESSRNYLAKVRDANLVIPLRDFGDSPEICAIGEFSLELQICRARTIYRAPLCTLSVLAGCKLDAFSAISEQELFWHVVSEYRSEFFRPLTYEEIRRRMPNLPEAIYCCPYCSRHYEITGQPQSATDRIIAHIKDGCSEAPHCKSDCSSVYRFRVVKDVDEIRKHVFDNLPNVQKCRLCDKDFEDADVHELAVHLQIEHRNDCLELR